MRNVLQSVWFLHSSFCDAIFDLSVSSKSDADSAWAILRQVMKVTIYRIQKQYVWNVIVYKVSQFTLSLHCFLIRVATRQKRNANTLIVIILSYILIVIILRRNLEVDFCVWNVFYGKIYGISLCSIVSWLYTAWFTAFWWICVCVCVCVLDFKIFIALDLIFEFIISIHWNLFLYLWSVLPFLFSVWEKEETK